MHKHEETFRGLFGVLLVTGVVEKLRVMRVSPCGTEDGKMDNCLRDYRVKALHCKCPNKKLRYL